MEQYTTSLKCPHGVPKMFTNEKGEWEKNFCVQCLNAEFQDIAAKIGTPDIATSPTGGRKEVKLARFSLLPGKVLWLLAEHYGKGAQKYSERNWEKGYPWSQSFDALMRHAWSWWEGEDDDPETGSSHLCGVLFHAMALFFYSLNREKYSEYDDRRK